MATSILYYGHGGYDNRGCEAIVRSTTALLKTLRPDVSVTLCSERPQGDRTLPIPGITQVLPHEAAPLSIDRLYNTVTCRLGASREQQFQRIQGPVIRAAKGADLCLSIGGDTYCYKPPERLYAVNTALRKMGKPHALWGCSVDPERLEGALLADMKGYTALYARESITHAAMVAAGLSPILAADPAFTLETDTLPLPAGFSPGDTVGINISPLALSHAQRGDGTLDAFVALIRHILDTTGHGVTLLPHVRWAHDDDLLPLGKLKARFADDARVLLLDAPLTAPQIKGYIARLRCLIAARTHATIAAYSTGVPTLVLGYSVKARGIAQDLFGTAEGHLLPIQEVASAQELIASYVALERHADAQRAKLAEQVPLQVARVQAAGASLLALTEARHE